MKDVFFEYALDFIEDLYEMEDEYEELEDDYCATAMELTEVKQDRDFLVDRVEGLKRSAQDIKYARDKAESKLERQVEDLRYLSLQLRELQEIVEDMTPKTYR